MCMWVSRGVKKPSPVAYVTVGHQWAASVLCRLLWSRLLLAGGVRVQGCRGGSGVGFGCGSFCAQACIPQFCLPCLTSTLHSACHLSARSSPDTWAMCLNHSPLSRLRSGDFLCSASPGNVNPSTFRF